MMVSEARVPEAKTVGRPAAQPQTGKAYLAFFLGWLVPGGGHFLQRKWLRGLILFAPIVFLFAMGLALQGKVYTPNAGDILDILGFVGDLGAGGLYVLARILDLGHGPVQVVVADYGTKFIVVAGLLNFVAAVDAHEIALGKKA